MFLCSPSLCPNFADTRHVLCVPCLHLQGLPATVTSLLALTALRLRDRQVLIKRTDIIENLGCATIIASDKTGTLTQNRMTVENVWCNMVRLLRDTARVPCLEVVLKHYVCMHFPAFMAETRHEQLRQGIQQQSS